MYLTEEVIDPAKFFESPEDLVSGASVVFLGMVRNHSQNRRVLYLEYEAYTQMAETVFEALVRRARAEWPVDKIKLRHRIGRVNLGQVAVAIEVLAAHRDEAYQASRFLIEEIKHRVPIWKKEFFADGTSAWSVCRSQHE